MAHRHQGQLILEFERAGNSGQAYQALYPLMRTFVSRLQEARELEALCQHAVEEVKRITSFGRVKAYRFDAEDNGLVLAEVADPATRPIWACASRRRTFRSRPGAYTATT